MVKRTVPPPASNRPAAPSGRRRSPAPGLASRLGLAGERMSRVDTAWLRMDSPTNLMMIVGVWVLRPGITLAALRERVQTRLLSYRRFVQCAREDATGAHWADDPDFDLARHVQARALPRRRSQGAREALQARVAELAASPLDRAHPLWHFELVERHDGGSALIARIHHCIADGIALIHVMMSLVDGGLPPPPKPARRGSEGPEDWLADSVVRPLGGLAAQALELAGDGAARSLAALATPQKSLGQALGSGLEQTRDLARLGQQVLGDAASLALMPDDSATRLKGKPSGVKRVAWGEPLPLTEVKAVGRALGCSVNDVLLSCVAGAIGEHLRACGDDPSGQDIRAMVPVNLRPLDEAWKLGNKFGLVPLVLPIGIANPVERLFEVRARMQRLKGSLQPVLAFGLLAVAGVLVKPAQDALLNLFGRKTTAVMTNVPGPQEKLRFCGATLEQTLFWVPQTGSVGVGVSILSYGGGVQFGLITDAALCDEPERIVAGFGPQFNRLMALTLMLPWGED